MDSAIKNRNLPLLLSQLRESIIIHFRPILNHFGLTEQQWRILRILSDKESLEPREICKTCQILSPSMAGILKRLEDMGLISREPMPGDKRRLLVSLTPKAVSLIEKMAPLVHQQYQNLEEAYGEELISQLFQTLDNFAAVKDLQVTAVELPPK